MFRKYSIALTTLIMLTGLFAAAAQAQGVKNFVVQPFNYMGPEKYKHYGKSIRSVLKSKLNTPGVFEPAPESQAQMLGNQPPASPAAAVQMLTAADVDYVVYGLVSMAGDSAILEINTQSAAGNLITKTAEVPHDQLSLELNKLASSITQELFNAGSAQQEEPAMGQQTSNPTFLAAQPTEEAPRASSVNPEFRYEGGSQNEGRVQSQGLRFASRGMTVCDGDGDGDNEVFILTEHKLAAYDFIDGKLVQLAEMRFANRYDPLNITSLDSNKDGRYEIIVSTYYSESKKAESHVFDFTGKGFTPRVEGSNYFLNVMRLPPNYTPTLVAQRLSNTGNFRSTGAREAYISKGQIVTGNSIALPQFGNIFNICFLPEGDSYKIVMLDAFSRLKIFTRELEADTSSNDTYNSSAIPISLGTAAVAGLDTTRDAMDEKYYYLPLPMKMTNLFSGGKKYELLLNKDVSLASMLFANFRSFTQGEIHSLYWDGTGMNLAWKTRRIKGTVIAYDVVDVDNDGDPNMVVLVNTYPGAIAASNIKTVLLSYALHL